MLLLQMIYLSFNCNYSIKSCVRLYSFYIYTHTLLAKCSAFVHPWAGHMSKTEEARKVFQVLMGAAL